MGTMCIYGLRWRDSVITVVLRTQKQRQEQNDYEVHQCTAQGGETSPLLIKSDKMQNSQIRATTFYT